MKNKSAKEKNFFSKFLAKIVRKFGYEIIDQNNFYSPSLDKQLNEDLSVLNKKSIIKLLKTRLKINRFKNFKIKSPFNRFIVISDE